ncbi:sigma-70 family RNA polymerase sigma factor [bacterium]|nr:sigma-70 family RNA polymerase sigma factor [candidate division CSSED10-310 bacterium]
MTKPMELLQKHLEEEKDKMFRIAWKMCGNSDDANEILQETALKALKNWDQFRGDAQISTWLYRIASNTCFSRQRKRSRDPVLSADLAEFDRDPAADSVPVDWSSDPLTQVINDELRDHLDRAIGRLPDLYRIVFLMRDVEGFSGEQTAEALDISVSNVKVRLHRARMFLRNELEQYIRSSKGTANETG